MGVVIDNDTYDKIDNTPKTKTALKTQYGIDSFYEQYLAGFPVSDMKDDETLAQFKARCQAELALFGVTDKVEWCLDGGRDS
jgi:hypothetical protein